MQFRDLNKKHGFTAVEMLFVVAVIGILTALAVKPISGLVQRIKIQSAADGVRRIILNARVRAVSNSDRHCGVNFVVDSSTAVGDSDYVFAFFDDAKNNVFQAGLDKVYGTKFVVYRRDKMTMRLGGSTPPQIVFRGDGSANTAAQIILTLNNYTYTVNVLASTGRVRVLQQ